MKSKEIPSLGMPARTAGFLNDVTLDRRALMLGSAALAAGATLGAWVPPANAAEYNLEIMGWQGYTLELETEAWRKANNLTMRAAIMGSQDDVTAKVAGNNAVRLDLAEYSNGYNEIYAGLKVLTELDLTKIPNYNQDDIYAPFFKLGTWFWDGKQWAIPWVWGVDTIIVRPDLAGGVEVKSYKDLLRPEFKGKLAFLDNPQTAFPQIAKATGYFDKFPNLTKKELADCFEKLKPYRDQAKVFAVSNGDVISLFASGEIAACFCVWSATPQETAKQGVTTVAVFPTEGGAAWADAWFIPTKAENIDAAHGFINQALSPEIQASICNSTVSCAVNRKAVALMDGKTKSLFDYDNFDVAFRTMQITGQAPRVSDKYATYDDWLQTWTDFKAGF